jgi:hypothetical protein
MRLREKQESGFKRPKHWVIGTCHTYRTGGEAVRTLWPDHYDAGTPQRND